MEAHAPTFPFTPEIGQRVFFEPLKTDVLGRLSYYGTVVGRYGKRWLVQLHNGSQKISFDPEDGVAKPHRVAHRLCWIGNPKDFNGMDYQEAMLLALRQLSSHRVKVLAARHRELSAYDEEITGQWTISDLITSLLFLAEEFGPDQVVDIDAGHNNVCLNLVPEDQVWKH